MKQLAFFDEIHDFQRFIRENISLLGNYTIISEQLHLSGNEQGILDMLILDNEEKRLVVLELKNETTTDKNIWQPFRYYDLLRRGEDDLKDLVKLASIRFNFNMNEINLNPKLVLVVPECNEQLLRTLSLFNDIDSKVVKINRFEQNGTVVVKKETYYPTSVFHKEDLTNVQNKIEESWDFESYKMHGINQQKINLAKSIIEQIKQVFKEKNYVFDVFYSKTKITITKDGKVWGHLFIKSKSLDYKLPLFFKVPKNVVINRNDFTYNTAIENFDIQKGGIRATMTNIMSKDLFKKYLG